MMAVVKIDVPGWLETADPIKLRTYHRMVRRIGLDLFTDGEFIQLIEAQDGSRIRWEEVRSVIGHRRAKKFGGLIVGILSDMIHGHRKEAGLLQGERR